MSRHREMIKLDKTIELKTRSIPEDEPKKEELRKPEPVWIQPMAGATRAVEKPPVKATSMPVKRTPVRKTMSTPAEGPMKQQGKGPVTTRSGREVRKPLRYQ